MSEIWKKDKDNIKVEMTVAIPVYNVGSLIWLALESLKNQQDIEFGWELMIWEEYGKSRKIIEKFFDKLPNCQRICYRELNKPMMLLDKWINMAKNSTPSSKIFVLQLCDEYSPPRRLAIHYKNFSNNNCLISTQFLGLFYNITNGNKVFYYGVNKERANSRFFTQEHLNLAVLNKDMKRIKKSYLRIGVNQHIKNFIGRLHGINYNFNKYIFTDYEVDRENWKYGLFISKNETYSGGVFLPFNRNTLLKYNIIEDYIPQNVITFLKNMQNMYQTIQKNMEQNQENMQENMRENSYPQQFYYSTARN